MPLPCPTASSASHPVESHPGSARVAATTGAGAGRARRSGRQLGAWLLLLPSAWSAAATPVSAQIRVQAQAPVAVQPALRADPAGRNAEDTDRPALLLESPNIDRFVLRAQSFLDEEEYPAAIQLLQDILEGRTLEVPIDGGPPPGAAPAEGEGDGAPSDGPRRPDAGGSATEGGNSTLAELEGDARHAVFSADQRLYRPVQRLCHGLLANLPEAGLRHYRSAFEVAAEQALAAAVAAADPIAIEEVHRRWFATVAGGKALLLAADSQLDRGRLRAALATYGELLELYPESLYAEAGIDRRHVQFRVALAFHLLDDPRRAREELQTLLRLDEDATLRLAGELVAIEKLAAEGFGTAPPARRGGLIRSNLFAAARPALIPLWEQRSTDPRPYRPARVREDGDRRFVVFRDGESAPTPKYSQFTTGLPLHLIGAEAITFLDHYRLQHLDLLTGAILGQSDGTAAVPDPRPGQPRHRIPSYDFACHRVVPLEDSRFVCFVVGPRSSKPSGLGAVLDNGIEVWTADGMDCRWRSRDHADLVDATLLAAPTPFGNRLLVPLLHRGTVEIACIDAASGELAYRVPIHRDGTSFARPPAVPIRVAGGVAYLVSGAGCAAAVDAHTGALRWIRRYERIHPLRPVQLAKRPSPRQFFSGGNVPEQRLSGFAPTELIFHDGLLVFGAPDSLVLHALDAATGQPVWMLSKGELVALVGHDGERLFAIGKDELLCIGLQSGVRQWSTAIPSHPDSARWRGRGVVTADHVLIPGDRCVHVRGTQRDDRWATVDLPPLRLGTEPLRGPFDLAANGPFLVASFAGGVQAFSTADALRQYADALDSPVRAAAALAQAGDLRAAVATLTAALEALPEADTSPSVAAERRDLATRVLGLCTDLALAMAHHGARNESLQTLDSCRETVARHGTLRSRWHLARAEVFATLGDRDAMRDEQNELYRLLEAGTPTAAPASQEDR